MIKQPLITEISEEDFRKLGIKGRKKDWRINGGAESEADVFDEIVEGLEYAIEKGYELMRAWLTMPVTVAIHEDPTEEDDGFYFDKFMNSFQSGLKNYQIGFGIRHLYSTRDHFEDRDDYWRIPKRETKVVYRVHLDPKWANAFRLKHRCVESKWPYGDDDGGSITLVVYEELGPDGAWKEKRRAKKTKLQGEKAYSEEPIDESGARIGPGKGE